MTCRNDTEITDVVLPVGRLGVTCRSIIASIIDQNPRTTDLTALYLLVGIVTSLVLLFKVLNGAELSGDVD